MWKRMLRMKQIELVKCLPIVNWMMMIEMQHHRNRLHLSPRDQYVSNHFADRKSSQGTVYVGYWFVHYLEWMSHGSPTMADYCPNMRLCCLDWTFPFYRNSRRLSNKSNCLVCLAQWWYHFADTLDALFWVRCKRRLFLIVRVSCPEALNGFHKISASWTDRVAKISTSTYNTPWGNIPAVQDAVQSNQIWIIEWQLLLKWCELTVR